ncbi:MAG: efflux RND transporter periplasmic adaptor subunit [Caulobacteraceae bacterium]
MAVAMDASNNAALLARSQYRAGLTDFLTLLQSEQSLLQARDSLASAQSDQALALVRLYLALGRRLAAVGARNHRIALMTAPNLDDFLGQKAGKRSRWVKWGAIALALVVVLFVLSRCLAPPKPPTYATGQVTKGDLTVTISATGNLTPTKQVNVGSQVSGLVEKVLVQNNDRVTKGQSLANLDLSRLNDALTQSQASLQAAEASVQQSKATIEQTKAALARDEQVFQLSGGKVPSQAELDTARADYARAVANLASAQAQVAQQKANVSTNKTNLYYGTIYAPVTGVVLSRQVEPGQTVAASFSVATLFTIAEDLSRMKIEVKVDEADVGELKEGAPATFTVDAYPGRVFPRHRHPRGRRRQRHAPGQQRRRHRGQFLDRGGLYGGAVGGQQGTCCSSPA